MNGPTRRAAAPSRCPCGPPAHRARGRPGRRGRAARACTPAAPRGSARDSTPAGSAADTAPSTPIAALAPTAAPRQPDGRPAPSSAGPHSSNTTRALYTKRHQVLAPAALALKPRHAGLEHPAKQELSELTLDELRQAYPVAGLRGHVQEGFQLLADHLVEHGMLGVSRAIHGRHTRHAQR